MALCATCAAQRVLSAAPESDSLIDNFESDLYSRDAVLHSNRLIILQAGSVRTDTAFGFWS